MTGSPSYGKYQNVHGNQFQFFSLLYYHTFPRLSRLPTSQRSFVKDSGQRGGTPAVLNTVPAGRRRSLAQRTQYNVVRGAEIQCRLVVPVTRGPNGQWSSSKHAPDTTSIISCSHVHRSNQVQRLVFPVISAVRPKNLPPPQTRFFANAEPLFVQSSSS